MTIKTLIQLFKVFTNQHPILQTFSWGNLSDYSREDYITKYPAIHFVPQPSTLGNTSQDITFSVLVYDLLNEYVDNPTNSNQLDSMALCEEILGDFVNNFINQLTQYGYFLNMPVSYVYFTDRFAESVCGVEAQITITIEQTACIPPYIQVCPEIPTQQYLEVELSESTKFKLVLWNDSGFSSPTTALCDYVVSGTAYGSLGTIYTGTETITEGQHQHQFNLSGVLLPGEVVSSFVVYSINTSTCVCPVNIDFSPYIPVSPTPTPTLTPTPTQTI